LPEQPGLETAVHAGPDGNVLTVTAKHLARAVWIDTGDLDVRLSNNAFDLLPGESIDIAIDGKADLDAIRHAITVRSLVDALKEPKP
jgi:beta-mannosidase